MHTVDSKTIFEESFDAEAEKRVDKITIKWLYDSSPNYSYLEEDKSETGKERLEGFLVGDWCFLGCVAYAEVSYSVGGGCRRVETVSSGGLWGIESDSVKEYLQEVEDKQILDLKNHLLQLCGITFKV